MEKVQYIVPRKISRVLFSAGNDCQMGQFTETSAIMFPCYSYKL